MQNSNFRGDYIASTNWNRKRDDRLETAKGCHEVVDLARRNPIPAERQEAKRRIADLQQIVGTDAPVCIALGSVKEALLEAALASDADVLMIGRSHPAPALMAICET